MFVVKVNIHLLRAVSLSVIFVAYFVCTSCGREKVEAIGNFEEIIVQRTPELATIQADVKEVYEEVKSMGIVEAFQEVQVSPEISGKIRKVFCEVGDRVKQGDLLAELDGESRLISLKKKRALLRKAEAQHKKIKRDVKKADTLFKDGIISDSEYDGVHLEEEISDADLTLAQTEVMDAEKKLKDTKITAPFAGKVASRDAVLGDVVTPNQALFALVEISKVKITVNLSEFDATKISVGSVADVSIDSLSGTVFKGRVETVGLKVDNSTRTFPVEIVVSNPNEHILPGMVARVSVTSSKSEKVITVPRKAIQTIGSKRVVSLIKGEEIEQRVVVTGPLYDDQVVVKKGLSESEEIVVSVDSQL